MRFEIFQPCDALKAEVACFIISENEAGEPYPVLPDTALVMGFQYKGRLSLMDGTTLQPLASSGVTGLQNSFRLFKNMSETGSVLVKFKPGGASAFFKLPMHELFEQSISLDTLITQNMIDIVEEELHAAVSDTARIQVIESFLLSLRSTLDKDLLVEGAIHLMQQSKGKIRIADLAKQLYTSPSPLEKRFRNRIGASPKKYAAIIRFRNIISHSKGNTTPVGRAYEAGYFDQAHFIKDFKRFTGKTPEDYFTSTPGSH